MSGDGVLQNQKRHTPCALLNSRAAVLLPWVLSGGQVGGFPKWRGLSAPGFVIAGGPWSPALREYGVKIPCSYSVQSLTPACGLLEMLV